MNYEHEIDVAVSVDEVAYMPSLKALVERPHPFVYFLSIHNKGKSPISICGRKWIVENIRGETLVVEGIGVVGKIPEIEPGDSFSYNSYHVISCDSMVGGAFYGFINGVKPFMTPIPRFDLNVPI